MKMFFNFFLGEWGTGGLFGSLKSKFGGAIEQYSLAKKMKNLNVGDVHLVRADEGAYPNNNTFLALLIFQRHNNRGYYFLDKTTTQVVYRN